MCVCILHTHIMSSITSVSEQIEDGADDVQMSTDSGCT